jgi:CheY-like chemotaxis protein
MVKTEISSQNISRVDVLIAEDNPVNQLIFAQILSGSGLAYQIVANGELAVEAFEDMQPSLILMDIGMPKLNGFEATKAIRAMATLGGGTVPIIAVTANAAGEDRESCLKAGMNDHLAKPISPEALLAKIAEWMPKRLSKTA